MAGVSVAAIPRLFLDDLRNAKHSWGWQSNASSIASSDDEAPRSGPISPLASTSSLSSLSSNDDGDSDVSSVLTDASENDVASLCSSSVGSIESDPVRPFLHHFGAVNGGWASVLAVPRVLYAHQLVDASQHAAHGSPPKPTRHKDTSDDNDADGQELRPVFCLTQLHRFELPAMSSQTTPEVGTPYFAPHIAAAFPCKSHNEWYLSYADIQHLLDVYVRPRDAVVDLGAGRSQLARDMVLHGYHNVTAIDNDAKLLPCVEASLAPFLHVVCMDAMQLTLAPASIDAVLAKAFFEMLSASAQCAVLTQVLACLRPGGILFVVAFNNDNSWWAAPDVARLLARAAVCIDDQPVGPIVGSPMDRSHACRARVWRTRASMDDISHRATCDAASTLAARYEWRLRAFERQLQAEEALHDDVLCVELPRMMNEDFRSLLVRQEARSRNNDDDIARAQDVLMEKPIDEHATSCASHASPSARTIILEPPMSALRVPSIDSIQATRPDMQAYPEVVVSLNVLSDLGDEAFAAEATDGDAACPPSERRESASAAETMHGVAVALVTHVLADAAALASSPDKKQSQLVVPTSEMSFEGRDRNAVGPPPGDSDAVHGVAVALVNHVIADVAAHIPSPKKTVLRQSQGPSEAESKVHQPIAASPDANLSTAAIEHGVAVALVTELITDATERASSPKKPAPEPTIASPLLEQDVPINGTSQETNAESLKVQAQATNAAAIAATEQVSFATEESAPALASPQDASMCMNEPSYSSGAMIVDTASLKELERLPDHEANGYPDDVTEGAEPPAVESGHASAPSSPLCALEDDSAACTNDDMLPRHGMRDEAHLASAGECPLNEVGSVLANLVDDVENECILDVCRLALAALVDALEL